MDTIKLSVWVGDDRKVILELPADIPLGMAQVVIIPQEGTKPLYSPQYPKVWTEKREQLRKKMLAADILSTTYLAPTIINQLSPDELLRVGTLPPGVRSTSELIDEERGPR